MWLLFLGLCGFLLLAFCFVLGIEHGQLLKILYQGDYPLRKCASHDRTIFQQCITAFITDKSGNTRMWRKSVVIAISCSALLTLIMTILPTAAATSYGQRTLLLWVSTLLFMWVLTMEDNFWAFHGLPSIMTHNVLATFPPSVAV